MPLIPCLCLIRLIGEGQEHPMTFHSHYSTSWWLNRKSLIDYLTTCITCQSTGRRHSLFWFHMSFQNSEIILSNLLKIIIQWLHTSGSYLPLWRSTSEFMDTTISFCLLMTFDKFSKPSSWTEKERSHRVREGIFYEDNLVKTGGFGTNRWNAKKWRRKDKKDPCT